MAKTQKKAASASKKVGVKSKLSTPKSAKKPAAKVAAKKVVAKKPAAKKVQPKKAAAKKIVAKKVVVAKKPVVAKKATAKKPAPAHAKKGVLAKAAVKKEAPKSTNHKTSKPLSVKKTKPEKVVKAKEPAAKKAAPVKVASAKTVEHKENKVDNFTKHQELLKKAVHDKKAEEKKKIKEFVMPKTTTSKVREYRPGRSILDTPEEQPVGPTMRYSDVELREFKDLIVRKLDAAKKELAYLQGLITRKDQMGGDESDNRYMTMEDGSLSMEREQLAQMASRQISFIDHLEKALIRIENKTYGICRATGKLIDKARLRAVPHATLSIEAKMGNIK